MLINLVRRDRPSWTDKECVKWLSKNISYIKAEVKRRTADWIKDELYEDELAREDW